MAGKKTTTKGKSTKRTKAPTPPPAAAANPKDASPAPGVKPRGRGVSGKPRKKREGLSGLDAAAEVLVKAGEPLSAKAIAQGAIAAGWKSKGATPHATLYSAMIREISTKGKASRFAKVDRGRFTAAGKGA